MTAHPPDSDSFRPRAVRHETGVLIVAAHAARSAPLRSAFERAGHVCTEVFDCASAWRRLAAGRFVAVAAVLDGAESDVLALVAAARQRWHDLGILLVAGQDSRQLAAHCLSLGAWAYLVSPFDDDEAALQLAGVLERRRVHRDLAACRRHRQRMKAAERASGGGATADREVPPAGRGADVAAGLAAAVQYRDGETGAHLARVGLYAEALALRLGWGDPEGLEDLRVAAGIHDVGKLGVPDRVLLKPSTLDSRERMVMERHAEIGAAIIGESELPVLSLAREIALHHHERWDGGGYPRGLAGEEIPLGARIVAVADVYDSLVHDRVYRPPMDEEAALTFMAEKAGSHLDPQVFDCFFDLLPEVRRIQRELRE